MSIELLKFQLHNVHDVSCFESAQSSFETNVSVSLKLFHEKVLVEAQSLVKKIWQQETFRNFFSL